MLRDGAYTDIEGKEKHYPVLTHLSSNNSFISIHVPRSFLDTQRQRWGMSHTDSHHNLEVEQRRKQTTLKDRATEIKAQSVSGSLRRESHSRAIFKHPAFLSSLAVPDQSQADTLAL